MDSKKTSAVWLHFEEQEGTDTTKCNCVGSLSNLRKHLKAKHAGTPPPPPTRQHG